MKLLATPRQRDLAEHSDPDSGRNSEGIDILRRVLKLLIKVILLGSNSQISLVENGLKFTI